MFDAIVVRRTAAMGDYPLDLGHLAEAMLFYRTVRLGLNRSSLEQLVRQCGPDVAVELVNNTNVDAVYLDRDVAVRNEDVGTERERHRLATIRVMDESYERLVVRLFRDTTGKSGKGRRMAQRFLDHTRVHDFADGLVDAASADWQKDTFVRRAISEAIAEFAPSYRIPPDFRATLRPHDDGYFTLDSNLDWATVRKARVRRAEGDEFTPGHLLISMVEMRVDLYLAAALGAGIAQDPLGSRLTRALCEDLVAAVDTQRAAINQFQELVVRGITDLRGVINSGACSFKDFLKVLQHAGAFRSWLDSQSPDENLVKSYFAEATRNRWLASAPVKELRWFLPLAAGFTFFLPGAEFVAPATATALGVIDRFVIDRFAQGWRPSTFVDSTLRPFVNR